MGYFKLLLLKSLFGFRIICNANICYLYQKIENDTIFTLDAFLTSSFNINETWFLDHLEPSMFSLRYFFASNSL